MKSVFVFHIGFLSIFVAKIQVIAFKNCTDSTQTIQSASRCPKSQEEWTNAAAKKNCSQFNHTCDSFEYHCLMNSWGNETIEVCAPSLVIVGNVCAEYNYKGKRVQRNSKANCSKCPASYNSTKSFKYQECYSEIKDHSQGSNANIIVILVLHVVCTVVGVLLAFIAVYKTHCKLRRRITSNRPKELQVNENDSANETFLANGSPNLQI